MNIDNMNKAIAIMTRAGKINMDNWQSSQFVASAKCEKVIHSCGTAACFAGWIGVSPEWKEFGGDINDAGEPFIVIDGEIEEAEVSLAKWLGLHVDLVDMLIYEHVGSAYCPSGDVMYSIYGAEFSNLTASNIIHTLNQIKLLGQIPFINEQLKCIKTLKEKHKLKQVLDMSNSDIEQVLTRCIGDIEAQGEAI